MLFLKNSHTNNLITPCLGLDIRRLLPGKKKKALHAHSHGTAVRRREMVFNSLWNIQQWPRCTFQSLLIVKPTENSPACVPRAASPQLVSPFGGLRICVNLSTCCVHCGQRQGDKLSETFQRGFLLLSDSGCPTKLVGRGVRGDRAEVNAQQRPRRSPMQPRGSVPLHALPAPALDRKKPESGSRRNRATVAPFPYSVCVRFPWLSALWDG